MSIMTPEGRSPVQLTDEPVPAIRAGDPVHIVSTNPSTRRERLVPCIAVFAVYAPRADGALVATAPGLAPGAPAPYHPSLYDASATGIVQGGPRAGRREPLSTWHSVDACPFAGGDA